MRFLIAGLGSIGRRHLRNLQSLNEAEIILLRSGRSTLPDTELADLPTEQDLYKALDRHQPDAVIVSNPTAYHLDVAIPAAEAGCHLLLEKPVSHNMKGVSQLASIVDEKALEVVVGFQFRFHPSLQIVRNLLRDGAIGPVTYVHSHWGEYLPDWHPWEDYRKGYAARSDLGGGVVLTLCHPFDYLRWLIGEIESVSALIGQLAELSVDVEDSANVNLRFTSGALGTVHLDYLQRPPSHWLQITGPEGCIRWDNADGSVRLYQTDKEEWETIEPPQGFERNTMFYEEMGHFLACVRGEAKPLVSVDDGVAALRIALAVKESDERGTEIKIKEEVGD